MSDFWDFTDDPNESGIPPSGEERDVYWEMASDMDILDDEFALDALWVGWFKDEVGTDERIDARELFFDYMDFDPADFDWDAWREYYGEAA